MIDENSLSFFYENSDSDEEKLILVCSDHRIDKNQRAKWTDECQQPIINREKNMFRMTKGLLIRENPDPQLYGEVLMTRQEYNNLQNTPCIFCNETECLYFYFRESFYRVIDYYLLNFDSGFSKEKNALFHIENQNDIFLPGKNSITQNFHLVEIVQQNNFTNTDDWFYYNAVAQFQHEAKFRDYILIKNTQSVTVNGKEYQIPQNPFSIRVDPQQLQKSCNVCKKRFCRMKNYTGLLREAFTTVNQFIPLKRNFDCHEELLVASNWTYNKEQAREYNFQYGQFNIYLPENPNKQLDNIHRNFMAYFLEHIKAYRKPFEQLAANSAQKNFCHNIQCMNLADQVCGRCRSVWYCSVQHQKSDWDEHKQTCKSAQATSTQKSEAKTSSLQSFSAATNINLSNSPKNIERFQVQQIEQQAETHKIKVLDGLNDLNMQSAQFEQKAEKVDDWDNLKNKQNLLLSYQNQLTPTPDISCTNPPSDIQNVSVNLEKSISKNAVEEFKEPQETIHSKSKPKNQVSNEQAVSLKNSDSAKSQSVIKIESPESQKGLPVAVFAQPLTTDYKNDVIINQKTEISQSQINDLEERVTYLEIGKFQLQKENLQLNEKLLKLEQEHFELRQQFKQLMRKFN